MEDYIKILLTSAVSVAMIYSLKELTLWFLNRKAVKNDRKESKSDTNKKLEDYISELVTSNNKILAQFDDIRKELKSNKELDILCFRTLYSDRIRHIAESKIKSGSITISEKENLKTLHEIYHKELGGNGFFKDLMEDINKLEVHSD